MLIASSQPARQVSFGARARSARHVRKGTKEKDIFFGYFFFSLPSCFSLYAPKTRMNAPNNAQSHLVVIYIRNLPYAEVCRPGSGEEVHCLIIKVLNSLHVSHLLSFITCM